MGGPIDSDRPGDDDFYGLDTGSADDTGAGDTGSVGDTGGADDTGSPEPEADPTDYRMDGPFGVATWSESHGVSSGCSMSVDLYAPLDAEETALVVVAHGFSRGPTQAYGWAESLASWGLTVAVPSLCHSSIWDTDHSANGSDLVSLVDAMGLGPAVYAGHSAGGLAAMIAASQDPTALAAIGLDTTDASNLGVNAASGIQAPVYGLVGESSTCNSGNNGLDIYDRVADAEVVRITDADHCDFEDETDWMCTSFCQSYSASISDEAIHGTIQAMFTAAAMSAAGLDPVADDWWLAGGGFFDALYAQGAIAPL